MNINISERQCKTYFGTTSLWLRLDLHVYFEICTLVAIFEHGNTNSNGCSQIKSDYKISIIQESFKVGFTVNSPSCTDASLYLVSISLSVIECNIYVIVKGELINMTRAWDKDKIWVPDRKRARDLQNAWRALYPLNYEKGDLTEFRCDRRPTL